MPAPAILAQLMARLAAAAGTSSLGGAAAGAAGAAGGSAAGGGAAAAGGLARAAQMANVAGSLAEVVQGLGPAVQGLQGLAKFAKEGGFTGMIARWGMGKVGRAAQFVSSQTGGQETAVGRTTGAVAGLADAATDATRGLLGMMRGALKAGRILNEWSRASLDRQSQIQMYSGQGGMAMMRLNLNRQIRDIEQARGTSGSFAAATASRNELEEAMQPMRQLAQTIENIGLATLIRSLALLLNIIQYHPNFIALRKTAELIERWLGSDEAKTLADDFFKATDKAMDKLTEPPKRK